MKLGIITVLDINDLDINANAPAGTLSQACHMYFARQKTIQEYLCCVIKSQELNGILNGKMR